jgi:antitoxin component of MazEF toxin-antitoxin module
MEKQLRRIGNSRGIILDKVLLELLGISEDDNSVTVEVNENGLLLKKNAVANAYRKIAERHRASLDKLGK